MWLALPCIMDSGAVRVGATLCAKTRFNDAKTVYVVGNPNHQEHRGAVQGLIAAANSAGRLERFDP